MFRFLEEILLPSYCEVCSSRTRGAILCFRCKPESFVDLAVSRCKYCFDEIHSFKDQLVCQKCELSSSNKFLSRYLYEYRNNIRDIILAAKHKKSIRLSQYVAKLLKDGIKNVYEYDYWDVVIPVPTAPHVLKERGFNQCAYYIKELNIKQDCFLVNHLGYKKAQAKLNFNQRRSNIKNVFEVVGDVVGKKILVVDDVITTGSTTGEIVGVLKNAKAKQVDVLALAKVTLNQ